MNENIDLTKILKDCPRGTKLYSTIFGEVKFMGIKENATYPIIVKVNDENFESFTADGRMIVYFDGECILFPSREQRDWSKFNPKKDGLVSTCEFKDGDILSYQCGTFQNRTIYIYRHRERFNTGYYVAISGDPDEELMIDNKGVFALNGYNDTARFATEEEKKKLFYAIKLNGYKWNAETKTLEKLVKPKFKVGDKIVNISRKYMGVSGTQAVISEITDNKYIFTDSSYISISNQDSWKLVPDRFDPKTLKPFDRILARNGHSENWNCDIFSNIYENEPYKYNTISNYWKYCIPYNEDTKHLVGTNEEAPEFYRYWED